MSGSDSDGRSYVLQVYQTLMSQETGRWCTIVVPRETTAAAVIKEAVAVLGADPSRHYVLAEVKECGGEEWVLQPCEQPVLRILLWPLGAQEQHPCSDGYYFLLRECDPDGAVCYRPTSQPCGEKVAAQKLVERGFLPPEREDVDDLCDLPVLTESSILGVLRTRFQRHKIYTYAGSMLVAVNPFTFLPIYNPKYVKMYEKRALGELGPHVFAIADVAYHTMLQRRRNQCVLISGESGSGKTQSTNFLIHCLTALSQKGYTSGIERTILGAGPVLEAFGNAKTAYNNNSSRFGKFIQVNYLESGIVRGAVVEKYLLEKSRLISREKNERNYHVFYYLLVGASEDERKEFKLLRPEEYLYLKQENLDMEDKAVLRHEFERLQQAMGMVGFLPPTKKQIFAMLAAILYLGNVTYKPRGTDRDEGLEVGPPGVLAILSDLLQVRKELLVEALTQRTAVTANDTLIFPYSPSEAVTVRDSMAKSLYSALFDWIVLRINHALLNKKDMEECISFLSIGVLDIFGFEDFKTNSFEQFCINYANEQLQFYFNQHIFKLEQEGYQAEGISWHNIDYMDNVGCIHLFSKKPTGLFYLLDEESNFPHATDKTLLAKLKQQHQGNPYFVPTPVLEPAFVVRHFAGNVKYHVKDFREKNTDHMRADIVTLLRCSDRAYVRQLVGMAPAAAFRWGVLRATVCSLAVLKEAGRQHAEKTTALSRCGSRTLLGELRTPRTPAERLCSYGSCIDFSFDRSMERPLEAFEDIFASYESKKNSRTARQKQIIPKNLIDASSLKLIMGLSVHDRTTRALLHLHKGKKPPSISAQFQASLSKLLETLGRAEPFFIRCIRSNADKMEMCFDDSLVLQQLRYTGMLETVRIRRSGYSAKYTFEEFVEQFRVLLPTDASTPQRDIANFFQKMGLAAGTYQIGKTKVFLKEPERQRLQDMRHKRVMDKILYLQRWFRAHLDRKQFLLMRSAAIVIQRHWRRMQEERRYRVTAIIQAMWENSYQRAEYLHQRNHFKNMQKLAESRAAQQRTQEEQEGEQEAPERKSHKPHADVSKENTVPRGRQEGVPVVTLQGRVQALWETNRDEGTREWPSGGPLQALKNKREGNAVTWEQPSPEAVKPMCEAEPERKKDGGEPQRQPSALARVHEEVGKQWERVRPNSLPLDFTPDHGEPTGAGTLKRYDNRTILKERAERWKEKRSEALADGANSQPQSTEQRRNKGSLCRRISISLGDVSDLSLSGPEHGGAADFIQKVRPLHPKRRLAHGRSGLMLKGEDVEYKEFWTFPLPPMSPGPPPPPLPLPDVNSPACPPQPKLPGDATIPDGSKLSTQRRDGGTSVYPQPTTPEKSGFLRKILKKRPHKDAQTSDDGEVTPTQTPGREDSFRMGQVPIRISRATRVPVQWNASLDRKISNPNELRHLDDFLANQVNDLHSKGKHLSAVENIFIRATVEFRENIKSLYALSNLSSRCCYKDLMMNYQDKVCSLAGQKQKTEVPLVVNLFQSILDGFVRAEIKKEEVEPEKPAKKQKKRREKNNVTEHRLDHVLSTYQVNIMQSCDQCTSYIWGMEKAYMCSSCKMVCHKKCLSKINKCCSPYCSKKLAEQGSSQLFGIPVCVLTSEDSTVPVVMAMLLEHVELKGLYTEGIYRKSGAAHRVKELHQRLEKDLRSVCLEEYPIHTVTGLIKQWLRELPEPLMTYTHYSDFLHAIELPEKSEQLKAIYTVLERLPTPSFNTLERLIFHLVRVAKEEAHNRMSPSSLAIIFAPCILRTPDTSDPLTSLKDMGKTTMCLEILLNEQMRLYREKLNELQQLEYAEALVVKQLKLKRQNTVQNTAPFGQTTFSEDESMDTDSEVEEILVHRIKSIKKEKDDLASKLPALNQPCLDQDSLETDSPLDDRLWSLSHETLHYGTPEELKKTSPTPKHKTETLALPTQASRASPSPQQQGWNPGVPSARTLLHGGVPQESTLMLPRAERWEHPPGQPPFTNTKPNAPLDLAPRTGGHRGPNSAQGTFSGLDIPYIDDNL
ncbi:unconventional myosin-IXb-like isoform X2 [Scleropages formosus]|uniref:unconventional myosin-IXb-like isoform X2 n=1 Tax=Scleropages formosus TaxID=113540 RepID=UPI0010FA8911|nr:unconventional myosin-IXb isoform X2 [Scleropages formosus]